MIGITLDSRFYYALRFRVCFPAIDLMPVKAKKPGIAIRMGSYTKVRLLEDDGRGKKKNPSSSRRGL